MVVAPSGFWSEVLVCDPALWPCSDEVVVWVVDSVVVVVEGEVCEVAPALPLTAPVVLPAAPVLLLADPLCGVVAGCAQGWLEVLPVALPAVPPVCAVPEAFVVAEEFEFGVCA